MIWTSWLYHTFDIFFEVTHQLVQRDLQELFTRRGWSRFEPFHWGYIPSDTAKSGWGENLPLWKMMDWVTVGMMTFPIWWESHKKWSKPPANHMFSWLYPLCLPWNLHKSRLMIQSSPWNLHVSTKWPVSHRQHGPLFGQVFGRPEVFDIPPTARVAWTGTPEGNHGEIQ